MMGVFTQLNDGVKNSMAISHPIGYILQENGCWDWVGGTSLARGGLRYGILWVNGKHQRAMRWMYEREVGPIPTGAHLDHLCRNTLCVNPAHLEPVTPRENILRGNGAPAQNARKTHCKHGHKLTVQHKTHRRCVECRSTPERRARQCALSQERYRRNAEHIKAMARARYRRQRGGE